MKEVNLLGDPLFYEPSLGILTNDAGRIPVPYVGEDKGWSLSAVPGHDELTEGRAVFGESHLGFADVELPMFLGAIRQHNPLPVIRRQGLDLFDELLSPAPQGDELDSIPVELGQIFVGGKLGIEDQALGRLSSLPPEVHELQDAVRLIAMLHLGIAVAEDARIGILAQDGQDAFERLPSLAGPVVLEHTRITPVGDCGEIHVDQAGRTALPCRRSSAWPEGSGRSSPSPPDRNRRRGLRPWARR